jgi:hypothetical protein
MFLLSSDNDSAFRLSLKGKNVSQQNLWTMLFGSFSAVAFLSKLLFGWTALLPVSLSTNLMVIALTWP